MGFEAFFGEFVRAAVWLPKHFFAQHYAPGPPARHGVPDPFECFAEAALAEAREVVRGRPEEVGVGEVEGRLGVGLVAAVWEVWIVVMGREGAEDAFGGEEQVKEELGIEGPVAGVVEDEDGGDAEVGGGGKGGVGAVYGFREGVRVGLID